MKQFTPEEIAEITKEYNDKRHQFNFPTVSAAESGVRDIINLNPEIAEMSREEMIHAIAYRIYYLAFG